MDRRNPQYYCLESSPPPPAPRRVGRPRERVPTDGRRDRSPIEDIFRLHTRPKVVGPCFACKRYGHATCRSWLCSSPEAAQWLAERQFWLGVPLPFLQAAADGQGWAMPSMEIFKEVYESRKIDEQTCIEALPSGDYSLQVKAKRELQMSEDKTFEQLVEDSTHPWAVAFWTNQFEIFQAKFKGHATVKGFSDVMKAGFPIDMRDMW